MPEHALMVVTHLRLINAVDCMDLSIMKTIEHPLLASSLGAARQLTSLHFGKRIEGQEKVYIQASLHADELPGMLVAWHLKQTLQQLEAAGHLRGEIILVPQANPIGNHQALLGHQMGRFDLASGENFNRNYPQLADAVYDLIRDQLSADASANTRLIRATLMGLLAREPVLTELHSLRHHLMLLAADADIVLDLHCDFRAALHVYTGSAQWPLGEPLACYLGSRAQLVANEAGGSPFDEACCRLWWDLAQRVAREGLAVPIDLACLAVTIELRGQTDVNHTLAAQDAAAIINFLRYRGIVTDQPAPALPALPYPATPLAGSENLRAPHPGIVVFHVEPGTYVEAGTAVAEVIDPYSDRVTVLRPQSAGVVYALEHRHYATSGMWVAKIAGAQAFKTGALLSA